MGGAGEVRMDVRELVTKEEVETRFVKFAARKVARQYSRWGVTYEDCSQEILCWYYSDRGQQNIERWLANDPQQTSRIRYTFQDRARAYAESEKAQKLGYDVEDVQWYSPSIIEALLPLALDGTYDGQLQPDYDRQSGKSGGRTKKDPAEGGDVMAMVVDVRRALSALPVWVELAVWTNEPGSALHDSAVEAVVQYLGGPRPFTGRRRVKSNAQADAETRSQTDD